MNENTQRFDVSKIRRMRKQDAGHYSFKGLGRVGKCEKCGKLLNENLHYKTRLCEECALISLREKKKRYRISHDKKLAELVRQVKEDERKRREADAEKRRQRRNVPLDPVVHTHKDANGLTVSTRGHCPGHSGCSTWHLNSEMSRWR